MDDYYELVGVPHSATREEIDQKIREQLRKWQRRTANADLDRRQAAERRVKRLAEARTVLLDAEKRRRYDRQLTAYRSSDRPRRPAGRGEATGASTGTAHTGTWLNQARGFLAASDHQSAAHAARETLRTTPNPPPETWTILARANTELGRLDDALIEATRAVAADPGNLEAQLALARVHERRAEWVEASRAYENACELAPRSEVPQLGLANSLARAGRPGQAVARLEKLYAAATDRDAASRLLARGLTYTAEAVLRPATHYRPGSPRAAELAQVQRMLNRARQVTADEAILARVYALEQELGRVRARTVGTGTPPHTSYPRPREAIGRTNILAIVALVLAITGLVTCVTAPLGAILGQLARNQIRERGEQGDALALSAIIVGLLVTGLFCFIGAFFSVAG